MNHRRLNISLLTLKQAVWLNVECYLKLYVAVLTVVMFDYTMDVLDLIPILDDCIHFVGNVKLEIYDLIGLSWYSCLPKKMFPKINNRISKK